MSYLDHALSHQPSEIFKAARANSAIDFFSSRAKFIVAIVEKIVNLVASFFKLILVDSVPAIINYGDGRANAIHSGKEVLNSLRDIPIGFTGLIFGQHIAELARDKFYGKAVKVEVELVPATV